MVCGINVISEVVFASLAKPGQLANGAKPRKTVVLYTFLVMAMWWYDVRIYRVSCCTDTV